MKQSALNYCLYLLKNRAQTRRQLEEKLSRKKYEPADIGVAIKRLEEMGLVNDAQFAHNYAKDKVRIYRRGRFRIAMELVQKGVDRELIDRAVAEIDPEDELAAARDLLRSRQRAWQNLDEQKKYARSFTLLSRRGFSAPAIKEVLKKG